MLEFGSLTWTVLNSSQLYDCIFCLQTTSVNQVWRPLVRAVMISPELSLICASPGPAAKDRLLLGRGMTYFLEWL